MKIALYPGSFDPVTNGHMDILNRSLSLFDKVYVCVASNPNKKTTFSLEERIDMLKKSTQDLKNVEVTYTNDLVITKAKELGASAIVRGLRAVTDFEFEFQLAASNSYIDSNIEMVFLMSSVGLGFISSSSIKEMVSHHVDVKDLVPPIVNEYLKQKYQSQ